MVEPGVPERFIMNYSRAEYSSYVAKARFRKVKILSSNHAIQNPKYVG
jgi:hypothetical protein